MGNPLLERWRSGHQAIGVWCSSRDPLVAEALAPAGPITSASTCSTERRSSPI